MPIADLPVEVLVHVFSFLGRGDLSTSSNVCKQWRDVSYDQRVRAYLKHYYQPPRETIYDCMSLHDRFPMTNDILKRIIEYVTKGAKPNLILNLDTQNTLIHYCFSNLGDVQFEQGTVLRFLQVLIDKGVDLDYQNTNGNTPLHFLANLCNPEELIYHRTLLKNNANPAIKNYLGQTPLHILASTGNITCHGLDERYEFFEDYFRPYINAGADLLEVDANNKNAIDLFFENEANLKTEFLHGILNQETHLIRVITKYLPRKRKHEEIASEEKAQTNFSVC